ncbi:protein mono-ADP-ribosyltransferase PARP14-like [Ptychodera flava]|uniref:protein mono-ADP-ribosyltransferase PARP14-like n=1 Tax=Ptychodera flava TaxID=63121 RepID=UPI00396A5815
MTKVNIVCWLLFVYVTNTCRVRAFKTPLKRLGPSTQRFADRVNPYNGSVAECVLSRENHTLEGSTLTVQQFVPSLKQPDEKDMQGVIQIDPCKLLVTGFKKGTSKETLELYFESKKKSGGGPVEESEMIDDGTFVITFESSEVAERVLSKENHSLAGSELTVKQFVPSVKQPDEKDMEGAVQVDPCKILVTGFKKDTSKETLELYFESKRKSGGGPVEEIEMRDDGTFVIKFESSEVAERVLSRDNHNWEGSTLTVQQFLPPVKQPDKEDKQGAAQVDLCKILVTGFKKGISRETLELYFESQRKSGGGPVLQSEMIDDGTFVITFESSEGAVQVDPCKILVTGFKKDVSKETLELYFESKRKSGGGPVEDSEMIDDGTFVITFESSEVAEQVLNHPVHKVGGSTLTVKQFIPTVQCIDTKDEEESDQEEEANRTIEVRGFSEETGVETLEMYFESKKRSGGGPIESIRMINDVMVVIFVSPDGKKVDFTNSGKSTQEKPQSVRSQAFCKGTCKEEKETQLPRDRKSFLLRGLVEGTSRENLELYLENCTGIVDDDEEPELFFGEEPDAVLVSTKKSGGGDVVDIEVNMEKNTALVSFKDYKVLESVLSRQHTLSKKSIQVQPYYECLGEVVSRDEPPARIPDPMTLKGPQFSVLSYIMSKQELLSELKQTLSKVYAQHEWPAEGKDNAILLIPNFPKNVENQFQKCKAWPKEVETALTTYLKNFKCIDIPVLEGIWLQVISQKDGWATGDVDVVEDQDSSQLFISGRTNSVEQVEDRVKRVIKDIEEQMQKAKQMIKDTSKLNGTKIKQLMMCSFAKMVMHKFPDVTVKLTPKHNQVTFEGLPNDVTSAKSCEILRRTIIEEKVILKPRSQAAIQKQEWNSLVQKLEDEHTLTVVIPRHNQHAVLVTGFETSVKSVLPQLQDYIAVNTEVDESVKIENGRMQYIQTYAKDEISNIQKGAKRLPLRMNIQSKGHFVILTISGTEDDVKIAAKELQQLADSVCRRPYPINKPGMAKLFMGDKGKSYLKMTEDQFKCIIDVNNPSEEDSTMADSSHEEDFEEIDFPKSQQTTYHILVITH